MRARYLVWGAIVIFVFMPLFVLNVGCALIVAGYPGPLALVSYLQGTTAVTAGDYDQAITAYSEAIYHHPKYTQAYLDRGALYFARGQYPLAVADFSKAIALQPNQASTYQQRAAAYYAEKDYVHALADYGEMLRIDPKNAEAYSDRGNLYGEHGDYEKGISDLNQAIKLNPELPMAYNNLAWILATCPRANLRDGKKAVELANKACELGDWEDFASIDTLAAAYAEAGDFDQAVTYETKCLAMPNPNPKYIVEGTARLALYKAHKPYREGPP